MQKSFTDSEMVEGVINFPFGFLVVVDVGKFVALFETDVNILQFRAKVIEWVIVNLHGRSTISSC